VEDVWVRIDQKAPEGFCYSPFSAAKSEEMISRGIRTMRMTKTEGKGK